MSYSRQSNLELLRICCMLMIVAGHIILYHKTPHLLTNDEEVLKLFLMSFFSVAVNSFVLISGYFGIKFKTDRFLRLIIQTFTYSVFLMCLSVAIDWHTFNIKKDLFAFLPIITKQYWFITCYVVLYIISPWLNKWIECLDRNTYKRFLLIGFIIVYLWPTISYLFNTPQFIGDSGYGIVNFTYLYLIGRYLNIHHRDTHSSRFYLGMYLVSAISLFISQYLLSKILGFVFISWISYNTIFIFIGSICLFMSFLKMDFHSSIINFWAKPCLAVYLIHMNPYIWDGFCRTIGISELHGMKYVMVIFTFPFIIYFLCSLVEICRIRIMGKLENKVISSINKLPLYGI